MLELGGKWLFSQENMLEHDVFLLGNMMEMGGFAMVCNQPVMCVYIFTYIYMYICMYVMYVM